MLHIIFSLLKTTGASLGVSSDEHFWWINFFYSRLRQTEGEQWGEKSNIDIGTMFGLRLLLHAALRMTLFTNKLWIKSIILRLVATTISVYQPKNDLRLD